jgi:hypothetical protein
MRRGKIIEVDGLDQVLLDELNSTSSGCVYAHRVLLWTDRRLEGSAALIRHELEHACQIEARPEVQQLHELAKDVIRLDRDNSGRLYQQVPSEADANAAAGAWVRSHFGSGRIDWLIEEGDPDAGALRSKEPPLDPTHLPERMVEFFVSNAEHCRRWAQHHDFHRFSSFLDLAWRGAGKTWEQRTRAAETNSPLRRRGSS